MATLRFESTDVGETEAFLSEAYTSMSIGGQAERTGARVVRDYAGPLNVDDSGDGGVTQHVR
jgi:hypothetical protein